MAKAVKKKVKKGRAGFFTKLLLLLLLVALGWQLYQLHGQVATAQLQRAQLQDQVDEKQQENDTLQESIDRGGSQAEKEEIARNELGLVSPGEKVFYDVSN